MDEDQPLLARAEPDSPDLSNPTPTAPVSFEELKLYFDSIERVTDRRIAMNRFNYSIAVAIAVAIGAVANLAAGTPSLRLASLIVIATASCLAILFCAYWVKQIDDAKQLNGAKFKVLSEMSKEVVFDSSNSPSPAKSFLPFDKEWSYLKGALTDAGQAKKLKVLEGSRAEYFVPRGFEVLFGSILLVALLVTILNFQRVVDDSRFEVIPPTPMPTASR